MLVAVGINVNPPDPPHSGGFTDGDGRARWPGEVGPWVELVLLHFVEYFLKCHRTFLRAGLFEHAILPSRRWALSLRQLSLLLSFPV